MRYAWLTDIHLNFVSYEKRLAFYKTIKDADVKEILITGDIAEASSVEFYLHEMDDYFDNRIPIHFVLGNHDFYGSSVKNVKNNIIKNLGKVNVYDLIYKGRMEICYLNIRDGFTINCDNSNDGICILGVDGWGDGGYGDYLESHVRLNDDKYIYELRQAGENTCPIKIEERKKAIGPIRWGNDCAEIICERESRMEERRRLAAEDAEILEFNILNAIKDKPKNIIIKKIVILTHVPPFAESSFHRGEMSDDNYLPYYACKATGDVIMRIATEHPEIDFLCLCGHTHGKSLYQPLPNLTVKSGGAEYGNPGIQEILEL